MGDLPKALREEAEAFGDDLRRLSTGLPLAPLGGWQNWAAQSLPLTLRHTGAPPDFTICCSNGRTIKISLETGAVTINDERELEREVAHTEAFWRNQSNNLGDAALRHEGDAVASAKRVAALEAEVATLKAELALLSPPPDSKPFPARALAQHHQRIGLLTETRR